MFKTLRKITLTLGLIGLVISSSCAQENNFNFVVTPITKNIYSIVSPSFGLPTPENKGWNSNSHFVVTEKGVLLFDTGSSELIGNKIKNAIKSVTDIPVRWIINSHSHADHWLGNAAFMDTAVEVIASKKASITMKKYGEEDVAFYSRVTKGTIGPTKLVFPSIQINQNQKRNFGGIDVEFIFSNDGHSPGDVLMWLPKQKIIFGGDVLSSDWMPVITGHGNVQNLIQTLHRIAKLNPTNVLTGHGKATTVKSVIRDANLLSNVWTKVKTDYSNDKKPNETLLDVRAKFGAKYRSLYKDFTTEIERHIILMYKLQN